MRPVLTLLAFCIFFTASAQNDSCIFLKKGAELEYRSFLPLRRGKEVEVTRFTLIVTDVKDSNNVSYCYITKKARSSSLSDLGYERHFVVKRDGDKMIIPYELYAIDTIYRGDLPREIKKLEKLPHITSKVLNDVALYSAYSAGSLSLQYNMPEWMIEFSLAMPHVRTAPNTYSAPGIYDMKRTVAKVITSSMTIMGPQKLEIEAGIFDCFRISISLDVRCWDITKEINNQFVFFFSPEYGLLQTSRRSEDGVYTILTRAEYEPGKKPED
jgi:hypothetical protein